MVDDPLNVDAHVLINLKDDLGVNSSSVIEVPYNVSTYQLSSIVHSLLSQNEDEICPYAFYVGEKEITKTLSSSIDLSQINSEKALDVVYQAQSVFKVRPVNRCSSSLEGHSEAIVSAQFSPTGSQLASGSGDATVRFWDLTTETPLFEGKGHANWVLALAWAPSGKRIASGCKNGEVRIWDPFTGKQSGSTLKGHRQWITSLAWEPLHFNGECRQIASASKDTDIRIWDSWNCACIKVLSGHLQSVTCLVWSSEGFLISGGQDRTMKIWNSNDGTLRKTLSAHGHWVNTLALNTAYIMRVGWFQPANASINPSQTPNNPSELCKQAGKLLNEFMHGRCEMLVSGSDDFTLMLWNLSSLSNSKPISRLLGHQATINDVKFSPDGRLIASASFDKSVRLWNGSTGQFVATLRGHVSRVYQVAWAADSRLLVSSSSDSTIKLWSVQKKKILMDLPGHADEVYAVDWSPDGQKVVSGGKDRILKIWRA